MTERPKKRIRCKMLSVTRESIIKENLCVESSPIYQENTTFFALNTIEKYHTDNLQHWRSLKKITLICCPHLHENVILGSREVITRNSFLPSDCERTKRIKTTSTDQTILNKKTRMLNLKKSIELCPTTSAVQAYERSTHRLSYQPIVRRKARLDIPFL